MISKEMVAETVARYVNYKEEIATVFFGRSNHTNLQLKRRKECQDPIDIYSKAAGKAH